jgi:hypothetical protein
MTTPDVRYGWADDTDLAAVRRMARLMETSPEMFSGDDGRVAWRLFAEARARGFEAHGRPAPGSTPGERFVSSASWRAYTGPEETGMRGYHPLKVSVPVLAADEVGDYLHRAAALVPPEISRTIDAGNALPPWPTGPLDLVNVVPTPNRLVRPLDLSATEVVGAGLPDGAASVEVTVSSSNIGDVECFRWSLHMNVDRESLLDDAVATRLIDTLMTRFWLRQLAFEVLMGDGSATGTRKQLLGVNSAPGVQAVAFATNKVVTLTAAVAALEAAGWPGPFVLVAAPTDKKELLDESLWRADRFPNIASVVGFDKLTAGTAFLGQFGAANLYMTGDGVSIEVSQDHATNFVSGKATVQPTAWVYLDIPPTMATAFVRITGF